MMKLTVQGRTVAVYTGGRPLDPTLPAVVFLHGALHDHSVWTLLARWFAHHGRTVLALDQPGHGGSDGPLLPDVEALGAWTLAVLDAAGVREAALVGHSMGSLIALEAAARAPERATRLVMIGSTWPMKVADALLDAALHRPDEGMDLVNRLSISTYAAKPSYPGPGASVHGGNRQLMARVHAAGLRRGENVFHHDFSLCNAYQGAPDAAAAVRCPVTLISGRDDQMTPARAAASLREMLNATQRVLPSGHSLMQEVPDALLDVMIGALG